MCVCVCVCDGGAPGTAGLLHVLCAARGLTSQCQCRGCSLSGPVVQGRVSRDERGARPCLAPACVGTPGRGARERESQGTAVPFFFADEKCKSPQSCSTTGWVLPGAALRHAFGNRVQQDSTSHLPPASFVRRRDAEPPSGDAAVLHQAVRAGQGAAATRASSAGSAEPASAAAAATTSAAAPAIGRGAALPGPPAAPQRSGSGRGHGHAERRSSRSADRVLARQVVPRPQPRRARGVYAARAGEAQAHGEREPLEVLLLRVWTVAQAWPTTEPSH